MPALESSGHSYLVRMIKPNLIPSHDWHVQPICQRSLRLIRLSGPFGSRPWVLPQGVLELVALAKSASYGIHRHFCANLLNLSNFHLHVKLNLFPLTKAAQTRCWRKFPSCGFRSAEKNKSQFGRVAQRKISKSNQRTAPEPRGLAGDKLLGHAMACSLWDSLQGSRGYCLA